MSDETPVSAKSEAGGPSVDSKSRQEDASLYLSLVENLPACIIRKDRDGRIAFVNDRFAALLGLSPEEIIGKKE